MRRCRWYIACTILSVRRYFNSPGYRPCLDKWFTNARFCPSKGMLVWEMFFDYDVVALKRAVLNDLEEAKVGA